MKYLKKIDWACQTIIWLILLIGSISISLSGSLSDIGILGMTCMFCMGCWQMMSSLLLYILKAEFLSLRKFHLLASFTTLLLLAVSYYFGMATQLAFANVTVIILGVVVPFGLAVFYYSITWRTAFPRRYSGKFLSHISF